MGHILSNTDWQDTYASDLARYTQATEHCTYALSHLAQLTNSNENKGRLLRLLLGNQAWMEVKARAHAGDNSYLAELRAAITMLADETSGTNLVALAALYTAQQVVRQRTSAWNDNCIEALGRLGRLAEARNALHLRLNPLDRLKGSLVLYQLAAYDTWLQQELFADVIAAMADIQPQHEQAEALRLIASAVYANDVEKGGKWFDRAIAAASAMQDTLRRDYELEALCVALGRSHLFEQAMAVWLRIDPANDGTGVLRSRTLRSLALMAADAGVHETAAAFIAKIPDAQNKVRAACALVAQPSSLALNKRVVHYIQARRINRSLPKRQQVEVRSALSVLRALTGKGDKALRCLARLDNAEVRAETGIAIAQLIGHDQVPLDQAVCEVCNALDTLLEPAPRIRLLAQLLALLLRSGHPKAPVVLTQLTTCIAAHSEQDWIAGEAGTAISLLAAGGYFTPAIAAAEAITNRRQRAAAFGILAAQMSARNNPHSTAMLDEARQAASAVYSDEVHIRQMLAVAVWLAQRKDNKSEEAFAQAHSLIAHARLARGAALDAQIRYAVARAQAGCPDGDASLRKLGADLLASGNQFSPETQLLYVRGLAQAGKIAQAEAFARALPADWARVNAYIQTAIVLLQNKDTRLARVLEQAKLDASTIHDIGQGPTTLSALARLLASVGDPSCNLLLDQLGAVVDSAEEEWDWQQAETARLEALVWCGWRAEAMLEMQELVTNEFWGSVRICSVEKWCQEGQYDQARLEAAAIEDDQYREEAWRLIAGSLAQAGQMNAALAVYSPRNLPAFMDNLYDWITQASALDPVTAASLWRECIRVAGWHDPFWRRLYTLLQAD